MKLHLLLLPIVCVLNPHGFAVDWEKQAAEDAKQDRTAIIFDGVTPNRMTCDTTLRAVLQHAPEALGE